MPTRTEAGRILRIVHDGHVAMVSYTQYTLNIEKWQNPAGLYCRCLPTCSRNH